MHRILIAMALPLVLAGCGRGPGPSNLAIRDRSVLTFEEIEFYKAGVRNAYDIIARLRPEYLRSRGSSSLRTGAPSTAVVYLDELRYGNLASLRTISAAQVYGVQYLNAADATTRFGTDHLGGAILITTR